MGMAAFLPSVHKQYMGVFALECSQIYERCRVLQEDVENEHE